MTTDDAIAEITHYMRSDAWCDAPSNEACEVALAALQAHYEKESPYPDGDTSIIACPRCGSGEFLYNEDGAENAYCGQCGQAIDWGGEDK
ncbi:hypothetical protein [Intestinimonas butyriciproducens]|uniref:hypothetical protein n=1 Tax=Intestinimonas butyriciproducens TaxID=1297617 RepID=UPI00189DB232|nr:hypothetical protein [Intestinimonas butyriciproducens]